MKKPSRLIAFLLSAVAVLAILPFMAKSDAKADTETARYVQRFYMPFPGEDYKDSDRWGHGDVVLANGETMEKQGEQSVLVQQSSSNGWAVENDVNRVVYCVEPGVDITTTSTFDAYSGSVNSDSKDTTTSLYRWLQMGYPKKNPLNAAGKLSYSQMYSLIARILYYGYGGAGSVNGHTDPHLFHERTSDKKIIRGMWYAYHDTSTANEHDRAHAGDYLATQFLIWETVIGERNADGSHHEPGSGHNYLWRHMYTKSTDGKINLDGWTMNHNPSPSGYANPVASATRSAYVKIAYAVRNAIRRPSFMYTTESSATSNAYTLKWSTTNQRWEGTFTDENLKLGTNSTYMLSDWKDAFKTTNNIHFSVSGNKLTVYTTVAQNKTAVGTTRAMKSSGILLAVKSSSQNHVRSFGEVSDPIKAYMAFTTDDNDVNLKLKKQADYGGVSGFKFELHKDSATGTLVTTKTTDDNGNIDFGNVIKGKTYYLVEQTPNNYLKLDPIKVEIGTSDKTVTASNTRKRWRVKIVKKLGTSSYPGTYSLEGAEYGLYTSGGTLLQTLKTDANGEATSDYYDSRTDCTVKELKAPTGLTTDLTVYPVVTNGPALTAKNTTRTVTSTDQPIHANVVINKVSSADTSKILTDAKFQIIRDVNGNGTYESGTDTVVKTLSYDSATKTYHAENLEYGPYLLRESTKAAHHVGITSRYFPFSIKTDGATYYMRLNASGTFSYGTTAGNFINTYYNGTINVTKTDGTTRTPLQGVKIGLYKSDDTLVKEGTTDANGKISFTGLDYGSYYAKETQALPGYKLDTTKHPVTLATTEATPTEWTHTVSITNERNPVAINLTKTSTDGVIAGHVFELRKGSATGAVIATQTTDANGKLTFKNVDFNTTYYLTEQSNVSYLDLAPIKVDVGITDANVTAANTRKQWRVKVTKSLDPNTEHPENFSLAGAKYELKNSSGTVVETLTTDANGVATSKWYNNTAGYHIVESYAPPGLTLDTQDHAISSSGSSLGQNAQTTRTVSSVETPIRANLNIKKVDATNASNILTDAQFKVYYDADGDGKYTASKDTLKATLSYDTNTKSYHANGLEYGKYLLQESKRPAHFVDISDKYYPFTISENGVNYYAYLDNGTLKLSKTAVNFVNEPYNGAIKVSKVDSITKAPVQGVEITLYNSSHTAITTKTTGSDGIAQFDNLDYGTYYVKETKTVPGYQINPNEQTVVLQTREAKSVWTHNVTIEDTPSPDINLSKTSTDGIIANHVFELRKGSATSTVIATQTTDANGKLTFKNVDPNTTYYLTEKADVSYVTLAPIKVVVGTTDANVTAANTRKQWRVEITKSIVDGVKYASDFTPVGAKYGLYDYNNKLVETLTIGENGKAVSKWYNNHEGYHVEELEAPAGLTIDTKTYTISSSGSSLGQNAQTTRKVLSVETPITGNLIINKVDSADNTKILNDAEFTIYRDVNANGKYDAKIDTVDTKLTYDTNTKSYHADGLEYGPYLLQESKAPAHYIDISDKYYAFNVTENGVNYYMSMQNGSVQFGKTAATFPNEYYNGQIKITKVSAEDNTPIANIGFTLYDKDRKVIATKKTDKTGVALFDNLDAGVYYVKETETIKGFMIDNTEHTFTLSYKETPAQRIHTLTISDKMHPATINLVKNSTDNKPMANVVFQLESSIDNGTTWQKVNAVDKANATANNTKPVIEGSVDSEFIAKYGADHAANGIAATDKNGEIHFTNLPSVYLADKANNTWVSILYRVTEVETNNGSTLTSATTWTGEFPMEYASSVPTSRMIDFDTIGNKHFTYTVNLDVTNGVTFSLPETGGHGFTAVTCAVIVMGLAATAIAVTMLSKKKRFDR